MGLSDEEFWRLGIKEFDALMDRLYERERRADYRTLVICTTLINTILRPQEPVKPEDFLPPKPQTAEQQLAIVKIYNAAFGGTVTYKGGVS